MLYFTLNKKKIFLNNSSNNNLPHLFQDFSPSKE